jgi:hypothetical protein
MPTSDILCNLHLFYGIGTGGMSVSIQLQR